MKTAAMNTADLGPCRFGIDELADLLDLNRAVLRQWIHQGHVTPAIRGSAGGRPARKSFFSCQQAIGLGIGTALYARGFLTTGGVKAFVDTYQNQAWAKFADWVAKPQDQWEEETRNFAARSNLGGHHWLDIVTAYFGEDASLEVLSRVAGIVVAIMERQGKPTEPAEEDNPRITTRPKRSAGKKIVN
jgi:hypothetical protein